ncbi:hypothetical protein ACJJTC_009838 [Scirpophaga incertulas]
MVNKCSVCDAQFTDGVQCSSCAKYMDFGCALISESGWRKLGADRRSTWKCPSCRSTGSAPISPNKSVSLVTILQEIRDLKTQIGEFNDLKAYIPKLADEIKCIKEDLSDFKKSYEFLADSVDELKKKTSCSESKVSELDQKVKVTENLTTELMIKFKNLEQRSRLNNVEIKGVPIKKDENLFKVIEKISEKVGYTFPKTQINYISRAPIFNSKDKLIIVNFLNRYTKEDFVSAARKLKILKAEDLDETAGQGEVFQLCLGEVWENTVRKNDTSGVFIINNIGDLNKFG